MVRASSDVTLEALEELTNGAVMDRKVEGEKFHTRDSSSPSSSGANENINFRAKLKAQVRPKLQRQLTFIKTNADRGAECGHGG